MLRLRFACRAHSLAVLVFAATLIAACERRSASNPADSLHLKLDDSAAIPNATGVASTWDAELGPAFLVEGASPEEAIVVAPSAPDTLAAQLHTIAAGAQAVSLFGRGGARATAQLGLAAQKETAECVVWPLRNLHSEGGTSGWSVGFLAQAVLPLALDSVDVLSSRDSMALVAEVSRLASTVTAPSDAAFRGLRFTAHDIRRFQAANGVAALVAHVIRRVNQEANPQEEQTLLIAERDSAATAGPYSLVYAERTSGLEDQVTTPEVIGGAVIRGRPTLIVARDNESGVSYSIVARETSRQWRDRWTSKPTTCN